MATKQEIINELNDRIKTVFGDNQLIIYKTKHTYKCVYAEQVCILDGKNCAKCKNSEMDKLSTFAKNITQNKKVGFAICAWVSSLILGQEFKQAKILVKNGVYVFP